MLFLLRNLDEKQKRVIRWVYLNDNTCGFGDYNDTLDLMLFAISTRYKLNKNLYDLMRKL